MSYNELKFDSSKLDGAVVNESKKEITGVAGGTTVEQLLAAFGTIRQGDVVVFNNNEEKIDGATAITNNTVVKLIVDGKVEDEWTIKITGSTPKPTTQPDDTTEAPETTEAPKTTEQPTEAPATTENKPQTGDNDNGGNMIVIIIVAVAVVAVIGVVVVVLVNKKKK